VIDSGGDVWPPDVAVIEAAPGAIPVTRPDAVTLMTDAGDAVYVIFALGIVTPFTSRAVVVNCSTSPTAIVSFGAVMNTEKTATPAGSPEHAVSSIVAARIAALLMVPHLVPRQTAAGSSQAVQRMRHVHGPLRPEAQRRFLPLTFFGVEMRRLALMTAIAVALPAVARAQACRGSVSFGAVPVRLGGGAIFGKDYTGYAVSLIAGKDNSVFGDIGVSRTYFDGYDDTGDDVFAELGWQRALGARAQLCPILRGSFGTGPDDDGLEVKSRFASAGLALGMTLRPKPSVKVIPNGSVRFGYAASDVTDQVTGKETYTDSFGVADLGFGLTLFNDRLAIQPTVQFPFAADVNAVSYGIAFSVGFALKR
jgi:hypothetical protein